MIKSLDQDLGDEYTWPHSNYLVQKCDEVSGWGQNVRLKYHRCRSKIKGLLKDGLATSIIFNLYSPWPFRSPDPSPAPTCPLLFSATLPCLDPRSLKIALVLPRDCRLPQTLLNCLGCLAFGMNLETQNLTVKFQNLKID